MNTKLFLSLVACAVMQTAQGRTHRPTTSSRALRTAPSSANYFVDGFHGGVYGHYPLAWYTQFMTDQLKAHPAWRIGLEIEPETWDSVRVHTPEAFERFRPMVLSRQVEYNNPTYAQPYMYNIGGESIIRQFQYGMRRLRHHFPGITFTTYSSEEPCFTSQLPQLLHLLGFKYLSLKCPDTCWGGYTRAFGGQTVSLVGPDGTAMTAVPRYACEQLQPGSVWQTTAWRNQPQFLKACRQAGIANAVGMCFQDAGWKYGPWLGSGQGKTQYVRWTDYIERYTQPSLSTPHTFTQEDVLPALMWGTQVLQRIGRQVRHTESLLVQTEKLAAMMAVRRGFTPDTALVDEAWRTLMLAQHHDSWIVPYNGFRHYGSWARAIGCWTASADAAAQTLAGSALGPDAIGAPYVTFYNTTAQPRTEVVPVQDVHGQAGVQQVAVPAFGHATYERRPVLPQSHAVTDSVARLSNDCLDVTLHLRYGGVVTHLYDKRQGKALYEAPALPVALPQDASGQNALFGELRGYFHTEGRFCSSAEHEARATLTTYGDLMQTLRLEGTIAGTPFVKTLTLRKGSAVIDCQLELLWQKPQRIGEPLEAQRNAARTAHYDTRYMLNVLFPTNLQGARLSKDAPFDVCDSGYADTFFNSWDGIKNNVLLHWADVSEGRSGRGLALFTDHTTSYTYGSGHALALTAQYAGPGLWWRQYPVDGPSTLRYALVPHASTWDAAGIQRLSEQWQEPLRARGAYAWQPEAAYIQSALQLSAVMAQTDGSLTVRLFNADGDGRSSAVRFLFPVRRVDLTDLDGHVLRTLPVTEGRVEVQVPRFGLCNLRVLRQ